MGGAVSSGLDNGDLIDNLKGGNYIRTPIVEAAFRSIDRADYMLPEARSQAYKDLAWKSGKLHLSAPCIYSEVMEGLELKEGLTFLNVGSGTGYLSTLVGLILGTRGINHGIEIHPNVVEYANKRLADFIVQSHAMDLFEFCVPSFLQGNGLCLAPLHMKYDRVYCGAGCPQEYENYFKHLIKVGGILVMPLNDYLLQVRRVSETEWTTKSLLNVSFAQLLTPSTEESGHLINTLDMSPPSLQVLTRSVIRTRIRDNMFLKHPELKDPPGRPVVTKKPHPRRICIPLENQRHPGLPDLGLDDESGAREMNALLSLVLSMGQNRVAGALRFDHFVSGSDRDSSDRDSSDRDLSDRDSNHSDSSDTYTSSTETENSDTSMFSVRSNNAGDRDSGAEEDNPPQEQHINPTLGNENLNESHQDLGRDKNDSQQHSKVETTENGPPNGLAENSLKAEKEQNGSQIETKDQNNSPVEMKIISQNGTSEVSNSHGKKSKHGNFGEATMREESKEKMLDLETKDEKMENVELMETISLDKPEINEKDNQMDDTHNGSNVDEKVLEEEKNPTEKSKVKLYKNKVRREKFDSGFVEGNSPEVSQSTEKSPKSESDTSDLERDETSSPVLKGVKRNHRALSNEFSENCSDENSGSLSPLQSTHQHQKQKTECDTDPWETRAEEISNNLHQLVYELPLPKLLKTYVDLGRPVSTE